MDHQTLQIIWWILIVVLFSGFFLLEGFDYGAGILAPFVAKDDQERRVVFNSLGPVWDGNEVWMLTAGGAMFAAFPQWYATLFSGFYLALFLMLVALIMRGVSFEFRSKVENPTWRKFWDWSLFGGSFVPALLWGVAFANIYRGVRIDGSMNYIGGFWELLNPYALVTGLMGLALFILHGAHYLILKTDGDIQERTRKIASLSQKIAIALVITFLVFSSAATPMASQGWIGLVLAILAMILVAATFVTQKKNSDGISFILSGLAVVLTFASFFAASFPNVMVSSLSSQFNLTIYNASSSQYTLQVMLIVALIFTPIVLIYQGFTFWIFREKVKKTSHLEY